MTPASRIAALCLVAALFAVPAAQACSELSAMGPRCPMMQAMERSRCHGGTEMSMDCCVLRPAPAPMTAATIDSAKLLRPSEAAEARRFVPASPPREPLDPVGAGASGWHDLGRYTLFSALLL